MAFYLDFAAVLLHNLPGNEQAQALRTLAQTCHAPENSACPQLILLDMNMPVLNGLGFLEAYVQMALAPHPSIVIVMLTTSLNPVDLGRAEQLSIAGFISKPLTKAKVATLLQEHFSQ